MSIRDLKKRIINRTADILSFPTRSLADAKRASNDRLTRSIIFRRERDKAFKASVKKRGRF